MLRKRTFVTEKLIQAVKNHEEPLFKIAISCDVNPSSLSRIVNCIETIRPNDKRILKLAEYLNLNVEDCFEKINEQ